MRDEDALIEALRTPADSRLWHPPLTAEAIAHAEQRLGFTLPPLVRMLYSEVANGGFAPGVFPLTLPNEDVGHFELETVVAMYRRQRDTLPTEDDCGFDDDHLPMLEWPEHMLMICDWGCAIYSCIDRTQPDLPVWRNDNNVTWSTFAREARSLHEWLDRALDGEDLFRMDWKAAPKVSYPTFPRPKRRAEWRY